MHAHVPESAQLCHLPMDVDTFNLINLLDIVSPWNQDLPPTALEEPQTTRPFVVFPR